MIKKLGIGCGGLLLLLTIIGVATSGSRPPTTTGSTTAPGQTQAPPVTAPVAAATAATTTPAPAPTPFGFGDGTHQVGAAVPAGTYRMRSAAPFCYWARLSGFGGTLGEILANQNVLNATDVVTIAPGDAGFISRGCGRWSADLSAITRSTTAPFGDGTYMVGVDIAPGTWSGPAGNSCYWARVAGFTGALGEIVANENARGSAVVTIAATDKGFRTHGCGTWTKI